MPDLKNRRKREAVLAAALLLLFEDYEDQGRQIDWDDFRARLEEELGPRLADTYQEAFDRLQSQLGADLGVDAVQKAGDWAETYSKTLAEQIVANTQRKFDDYPDVDEFPDQFDAARAKKIAITETTRANTAGEFGVVTAMAAIGLAMPDAEWNTAQDEKVCDECEPLDGQPQDVWQWEAPAGPPLHVNCRCWLSYE